MNGPYDEDEVPNVSLGNVTMAKDLWHKKLESLGSDESSVDSMRRKELMQFICGMLDPAGKVTDGPIAPPNGDFLATQIKPVTVYANLAAGSYTGAVIWLPQCGTDWIHRFTLFTQGTAIPVKPSLVQGTIGLSGLDCALNRSLFIPVVVQEDLAVTPKMYEQFTRGRLVGAIVSLRSDATSTTRAAMSGTFSAGALNDTRASPDFTAPSLKQQSRSGEAIIDCKIQNGVVALLGPDIPPSFNPLHFESTFGRFDGAYVQNILGEGTVLTALAQTATAPYKNGNAYSSAWISPFTTLTAGTQSGQPSYAPPLQIAMEPLALPDSFGLQLSCFVDVLTNTNTYPQVGTIIFGSVIVLSYFASNEKTNTNSPQIVLRVVSQRIEVQDTFSNEYYAGLVAGNAYTYAPPGMGDKITANAAGTYGYYRVPQVFSVEPKKPENTTWIGTLVHTTNTLTDTNGVNTAGGILTGPAGTATSIVTYQTYTRVVSIDFIANRIYNTGVLGPARVIRWDNVASGQNILVNGTLVTEVVPGGEIAPFYQGHQGGSGSASGTNLLGIAACLFNSTSNSFKRIYTGLEYDDVLTKLIPTLDAERIVQQVKELGGTNVLHSAGFFDFIKKVGQHALKVGAQVVRQAPKLIEAGKRAREVYSSLQDAYNEAQRQEQQAAGNYHDDNVEFAGKFLPLRPRESMYPLEFPRYQAYDVHGHSLRDARGEYECEGMYSADGDYDAIGQYGPDSDDEIAAGDYGAVAQYGQDSDSDRSADGDYEAIGDFAMNQAFRFNRVPKGAQVTIKALDPSTAGTIDTFRLQTQTSSPGSDYFMFPKGSVVTLLSALHRVAKMLMRYQSSFTGSMAEGIAAHRKLVKQIQNFERAHRSAAVSKGPFKKKEVRQGGLKMTDKDYIDWANVLNSYQLKVPVARGWTAQPDQKLTLSWIPIQLSVTEKGNTMTSYALVCLPWGLRQVKLKTIKATHRKGPQANTKFLMTRRVYAVPNGIIQPTDLNQWVQAVQFWNDLYPARKAAWAKAQRENITYVDKVRAYCDSMKKALRGFRPTSPAAANVAQEASTVPPPQDAAHPSNTEGEPAGKRPNVEVPLPTDELPAAF